MVERHSRVPGISGRNACVDGAGGGVGFDHAGYLGNEIGDLGIDFLQKAVNYFDPDGLMNPGVLVNSQDSNSPENNI